MITARIFLLHLLVLSLSLSVSGQTENRYAQFDSSVQQVFALISSGNDLKAIIVGEPALQQGRELFKSDEPRLIDFESMLALAYMRVGRWQDAQSVLLAIVQSSNGPSVWLRDAQFFLALLAGEHGAAYESNQRLRVALAVASSLPASESPTAERIRNSLAQSDLQMGNVPEALELTWQNLEYVRTHPGE
jgi:tetratricopeptide (TPR) repeat protein